MYLYLYIHIYIYFLYIYMYIYIYICVYIYIYPLSAETLEPLAHFVRKLSKDSNSAEDGFPGLINQKFLGSFSTKYDKLVYFLEFSINRRPN